MRRLPAATFTEGGLRLFKMDEVARPPRLRLHKVNPLQ
jgi:hypothetical protein